MKTAFNGGRGGMFNSGSSIQWQWPWGLQIGNDEVMMENDISGGGWQRWVSAFDGGDGRRWVLAIDGGNGQQLCRWWTIETAFNGGSDDGV